VIQLEVSRVIQEGIESDKGCQLAERPGTEERPISKGEVFAISRNRSQSLSTAHIFNNDRAIVALSGSLSFVKQLRRAGWERRVHEGTLAASRRLGETE